MTLIPRLDMAALDALPLDPSTKGLPYEAGALTVGDVGRKTLLESGKHVAGDKIARQLPGDHRQGSLAGAGKGQRHGDQRTIPRVLVLRKSSSTRTASKTSGAPAFPNASIWTFASSSVRPLL